jgi:xylulose-5-phosphate/fructose-6-phosphate phosphoketolase
MAVDGGRDQALQRGARHLDLGEQRCRRRPDVVLACAETPTLETLAAVGLLRDWLPALKVRVVNVVDLMTLQPPREHPHGLADAEFDAIFTRDRPIVFAFHGYPWLIHRLTYRRNNHGQLHVRGYKEQGTTTTPFDMTVLNDLDRFHLVEAVLDHVPGRQPPRARAAARPRQAGRRMGIHPSLWRGHARDPRSVMAGEHQHRLISRAHPAGVRFVGIETARA